MTSSPTTIFLCFNIWLMNTETLFKRSGRPNILTFTIYNSVVGVQASSFIKKTLLHWCFLMKSAKFLRIPILKNICERLFLFVSPQNTITEIGGKFGLDEISTECNVNILLNVTFLFSQIQSYNLYLR